jgi:hypothetical protein
MHLSPWQEPVSELLSRLQPHPTLIAKLKSLGLAAVSRFFEMGLSMPEVALISGHRDPRMLFRHTHHAPQNLPRKLAHLLPECNL